LIALQGTIFVSIFVAALSMFSWWRPIHLKAVMFFEIILVFFTWFCFCIVTLEECCLRACEVWTPLPDLFIFHVKRKADCFYERKFTWQTIIFIMNFYL
jgi:hypothetical protein